MNNIDYTSIVNAANLPKPKKNEEVQKVLHAEEAQLADIIAKAEANAASAKVKPCTTPSCNISWSSVLGIKSKKVKSKTHGGRKYKNRTRKRQRLRRTHRRYRR